MAVLESGDVLGRGCSNTSGQLGPGPPLDPLHHIVALREELGLEADQVSDAEMLQLWKTLADDVADKLSVALSGRGSINGVRADSERDGGAHSKGETDSKGEAHSKGEPQVNAEAQVSEPQVSRSKAELPPSHAEATLPHRTQAPETPPPTPPPLLAAAPTDTSATEAEGRREGRVEADAASREGGAHAAMPAQPKRAPKSLGATHQTPNALLGQKEALRATQTCAAAQPSTATPPVAANDPPKMLPARRRGARGD